jgi:hypothetical protein
MSSSSSLSSSNEDDFFGGNCFGRTVGGLRSSSNELERVLDGLGDVNVMDFLRWELFLGLNMSSSSSSCDEWDIFRGNSFVGTVGWVESTRNESESPRGGLGDVIKALDFLRWELLLGLDLSLSSSGFFRGNSFVGTDGEMVSSSNESESPSGGLGNVALDFLREEGFLGLDHSLSSSSSSSCDERDIFRVKSFVGTVVWVESTSNESESPSGDLGDVEALIFLREEGFLGLNLTLSPLSSSSCDERDIFRGDSFVGTVDWVESTSNESE